MCVGVWCAAVELRQTAPRRQALMSAGVSFSSGELDNVMKITTLQGHVYLPPVVSASSVVMAYL